MIDRRTFLLSLPLLGLGGVNAAARPYRARLIAGEWDGVIWTAGIDIVLDEGWKTYWRMPGEAGIPPSFDWQGSQRVKAIEVLWPAPRRFDGASGETVGFEERVVFPVRVTAESAEAMPELALSMFLGVCKEVCIPAKFSATLAFGQAVPADLDLIQTYLARVPEKRAFVKTARIADGQLLLDLLGDAPADPDLFVESETLAYFRAPRKDGDAYALPIDGLKDPLSLRGKALRITLVSDQHRLEQDIAVE
jgi:DsbC/DsbD-like thiol-disulfide interchange protein